MKPRKVYVSPLSPHGKEKGRKIGWLLFFSTYADEGGSEPAAFVEDEKGQVIVVDPSQISFVYPLSELEKRDRSICETQVYKEFFPDDSA